MKHSMKIKTLTFSIGLLAISSLMAQADLIGAWNFANSNLNDVVTGTAHQGVCQTAGSVITPVFSSDTPLAAR